MPCRGPCGNTPDGGKDYKWGPGHEGCTHDVGHSGPCTWEKADEAKEDLPQPEPVMAVPLTMTQLLCSACRALDRLGYDFGENPALDQWWDAHKRADDVPPNIGDVLLGGLTKGAKR